MVIIRQEKPYENRHPTEACGKAKDRFTDKGYARLSDVRLGNDAWKVSYGYMGGVLNIESETKFVTWFQDGPRSSHKSTQSLRTEIKHQLWQKRV